MSPAEMHRWRAAVVAVETGDAPDGIDVLANILFGAEERAKQLLEDDVPVVEGDYGVDDVVPAIAVRDEAGRAIVAARLEREPGTDRFTLVLLTEES